MILWLYQFIWKILYPLLCGIQWVDLIFQKFFQTGFIPRHWFLAERLNFQKSFFDKRVILGRNLQDKSSVWLHSASLGESKGLWGFVESQLLDATDWANLREFTLVITTSTSAGLEFLGMQLKQFKIQNPALALCPIELNIAPFDCISVVNTFIVKNQIKLLCLFEMELWPNYIKACRQTGGSVFFVSARISKKAIHWAHQFPGTARHLLSQINWIQVQDKLDAKRVEEIFENIKLPGPYKPKVSLGYDFKAVHFLRHRNSSVNLASHRIAFVSLHLAELQQLIPALQKLMQRFPLTIFPRHLSELPDFLILLNPLGFQLRSKDPSSSLQIVDSMGKVQAILGECHSAFVGGSLVNVGCHNLWEPFFAGLKIYFGPFYHNQESLAQKLLALRIAEVVNPENIGRIEDWQKPTKAIMDASQSLLLAERAQMTAALAEFRDRIFATFKGTPKSLIEEL